MSKTKKPTTTKKPRKSRAAGKATTGASARADDQATPDEVAPDADDGPPPKLPKIDPNVERTAAQDRLGLRRKVRMFYDLQRLRLQSGGRTHPQAEGGEIQLHEVDVAILERRSGELHLAERHALADVAAHLRTIPFYRNVLSDKNRFRGIGPTMAGVILSEFDIAREDTPSKMWAFAGLAPVDARRCKSCHSVVEAAENGTWKHVGERRGPALREGAPKPTPAPKCPASPGGERIDFSLTYASGRAQRPVAGQKLNYNSFLRTKLVGVLGDVLIKVGSPWRKFYDEYKHRKVTAGWGRNDGHRHNAAKRYMIKMLLLEIWKEWRTALGLPVRDSYHQAKQGGHGGPTMPVNQTVASAPIEDIDPEVAAELETLDEVA